ncbi:3519_t:CDS:2 [Paraglomus occultum]|uniref:3519_t:CDS:1 n=1 Tax=Paraglomus occultum TaxID=144539 RepID=A0A9N8ZWD0_9GLOM|nr:3519_t:CDS:2 [Paraglomus occultum]
MAVVINYSTMQVCYSCDPLTCKEKAVCTSPNNEVFCLENAPSEKEICELRPTLATNDPLLIIEYNQPGLAVRNITEADVAQLIRGTPGYRVNDIFPNSPPARLQSNMVFSLNSGQLVADVLERLYDNYHLGRQYPIVGRVYVVTFRRAGTFEAVEMYHIFD